ncbi:MAG: hypothetical protein JXA10_06055, partial [Anaerolineae bacterium]|nr:hypothetical protein [Anaerolineae bacterium]
MNSRFAWIIVLGVMVGVVVSVPMDQSRAQAGPLATLDPVSGLVQHQTAFANPQDPAAWQTVIAPLLVNEGDRIRTDAAGLAYLTFFEGIQTEIRANTFVVVSTLDLPADGSVNISLDVLVGA